MDYARRRLTDAEAGVVKTHLADCAECRAVLDEEARLGEALAALPLAAPRVDLWDTVRLRRLALDIPLPEQTRRAARWHPAVRGWTTAVAIGATAVALMLAPLPRAGRQAAPGSGARVLAQTLDTARQVTRQSDDPLNDLADSTWDALSLPETPS